ncbi:MAG: hypothetical protein JKY22_00970 [Flavobacteriaceae bacterium]|nr:hypothetical protein [Flavobacteriaceae bacterium]
MAIEKNTKTKTITLQKSIVDKVEERAKRENRNFSNMVETILKNATNQQQVF